MSTVGPGPSATYGTFTSSEAAVSRATSTVPISTVHPRRSMLGAYSGGATPAQPPAYRVSAQLGGPVPGAAGDACSRVADAARVSGHRTSRTVEGVTGAVAPTCTRCDGTL
ncbi:hypothetical protein Athai_50960 [Actinocatenispora thailandica]|uniref:Uncharacterized protein n=1 Tax=Actinocatenispora thailandica TaxID=227318 RepID=A0A7R7HYX4_9ACTN|nr:hypothetical protein Athai_50960 [Actinocatenispora thailandica]